MADDLSACWAKDFQRYISFAPHLGNLFTETVQRWILGCSRSSKQSLTFSGFGQTKPLNPEKNATPKEPDGKKNAKVRRYWAIWVDSSCLAHGIKLPLWSSVRRKRRKTSPKMLPWLHGFKGKPEGNHPFLGFPYLETNPWSKPKSSSRAFLDPKLTALS